MRMLWSGPQAKRGGPYGRKETKENQKRPGGRAAGNGRSPLQHIMPWLLTYSVGTDLMMHGRAVISALLEVKARGLQVQGQPQQLKQDLYQN